MKFEESISWGVDMGSEHERYLTEKVSCSNSNWRLCICSSALRVVSNVMLYISLFFCLDI